MTERKLRFFGGFIGTQEKWLNRMSARGLRLESTDRLFYYFTECEPGEYVYRVEYIANRSKSSAEGFREFLTELGYRCFYKNMNLNLSLGKVSVRPFAESGGRLATNSTTYNRELLIVEKKNDGKPFELHTSNADRAKLFETLSAPWMFTAIAFALAGIITKNPAFLTIAAVAVIPGTLYLANMIRYRIAAKTTE